MYANKIARLIATGDPENIKLAFQLIKGAAKDSFKYFNALAFFEQTFDVTLDEVPRTHEFMTDEKMNRVVVAILRLGGLPEDLATAIVLGYEESFKILIDDEGSCGLSTMHQKCMVDPLNKIIRDYRRNQLEVGIKYLYIADEVPTDPKEIEKGQKKLMKSLNLQFVKSHSIWRNKDRYDHYDIYCTKDKKIFFESKKGRFGYGGYSTMFAYDVKKGMRVLKKIMLGKTPVESIKEIEIGDNGLSQCTRSEYRAIRPKKRKYS